MIPDVTAAALARLEHEVGQLRVRLDCVLGLLMIGPHADRGPLLERARTLTGEPAGRVPVVSDPDGGPPEPMT